MRSEGWSVATLGSVADVVSGQSPTTAEMNEKGVGYPFFQGARDFGVRFPKSRVYTESPRRIARDGDILLSVRAPVGRVNRARRDVAIGRGLFAVRGRTDACHSGFLEYFLRAMEHRWQAHESGGSVFSNLSRASLLAVEISLPPLDEQTAIAEILGALDERIERANRLQSTIQHILSAEFRHNFTSGTQIAVSDVAETTSGRSYKTSDLRDSPVGLVNLKNIPRFGGFTPSGAKGYVGGFKPSQELFPGDLVVAHTDMTQNGDVVGRVGRVRPCPPFSRMVASMDLVVVRPCVDWMTSEFLHEVLSTPRYVAYAKSRANGTTVLHLKKDLLPAFTFNCPEPNEVTRFTQFAVPLWQMHDRAEAEADAARRLRDALLPKLVSGEVRIPNPQALLEPVG